MLAVAAPCLAGNCAPPLSPADLRALAERPAAVARAEAVDGGPGFSAYLVDYQNAGLYLHALVAVPDKAAPPQGYPVLIANHGFHPDPPRYGFTPDGRNWRPGNYYRPVPAAFTAAGFLVVMPDFRGHNGSATCVFMPNVPASAYYAEDVVALIGGLAAIDKADTGNLFLWGHSMGGPITLQTLLASASVRAVSLWSTANVQPVMGDTAPFDFKHSRAPDLDGVRPTVMTKQEQADSMPAPLPNNRLTYLRAPLLLHHAVGDKSTAYSGSANLAEELQRLGKSHRLHSYPGNEHFLTGAQFETAVARDIEFFRTWMRPATAP